MSQVRTDTPALFESLNARLLTSEQVASSFVPTPAFFDLLKLNHNVVIGPRGSGKTTLLKMLQLPALRSWNHISSEQVLDGLQFVSAFIPTDIAWKQQWDLIDDLPLRENLKEQLKNSIFASHTLRALVESIRFRTSDKLAERDSLHRFVISGNKTQEAELCKLLASALGTRCDLPSLAYLELQLRARNSEIGEYINFVRATDRTDHDPPEFVYKTMLDSVSLVIEIVNEFCGMPDQKWALLFDELELAPSEIRKNLLSDTRSTDSRIVFKLSISPYSNDLTFTNPVVPAADHDFIPINLWYSHKEEARPFCYSLFDQMSQSLGFANLDPDVVFSQSEFDLGNSPRLDHAAAYAKGTPLYHRFRKLISKDPTFARYIEQRKINIQMMDKMSEKQRASKVRKVTNIVSVREAWRREDGQLGSKRKPSLYTGASTLFAITEGNPRTFIGIVGPLLKEYAKTGRTIKATKQSSAILQACTRFRSLLSTIPASTANETGLNHLLDKIGSFFFSRVVVEPFSSDPPTTFIVDENVSSEVKDALGKALNAGAIVFMQSNPGNPLLDDLKGKRFRLSYLLAPHYKLPLLANKSRALSNILNQRVQVPTTPDLFTEYTS